ncbi:MAG: TIGR02266 family protein [Deltaproteobacteria bacterium]|nr:TIGR02266 family protein [Deltaproteobacteria bacterium]
MDDDKIIAHKREISEYKGDEEQRRQHIRFPVCISVKYSGNSFDYCDYILNISSNGVFIMTDKPMQIGEHIKMQFNIPHNKVLVELTGRVVWVNKQNNKHPRGMGIEFIDYPEYSKKMLEEYLSSQRHLLDVEI